MSLPLDPEPFECYGAVVTDPGETIEDMKWERRLLRRHARCHEGDVHFFPREGYEQDGELYPDDIWDDED